MGNLSTNDIAGPGPGAYPNSMECNVVKEWAELVDMWSAKGPYFTAGKFMLLIVIVWVPSQGILCM